MRRLFDRISRGFFRPLAFFSKEFTQIRRQPRLVLMLILGPFSVLLLFGLGYASESKPVRTVLVLPADSGLAPEQSLFQDQFIPPFELVGVTQNQAEAVRLLDERDIEAVVVFPERAQETIRGGEQATIDLLYNELDPLRRSWLEYYAYVQANELNRRVLVGVVEEQRGQASNPNPLVAAGFVQLFQEAQSIPSEVLISPFKPRGQNIAPTTPDYVQFYAPGVLALLVQHIAVTFTALALVRERLRGAVEVFRVAPVSSREIMFGKYLSYFLQTAVVTVLLVSLMALILDIPFLGSREYFAATLALLAAASLSLGFLISAFSKTETQAVQLSLLVLLASVFFSGFFLSLDNLLRPVWVVSYSLPVTYGVRALQDLMLRGDQPPGWLLTALAGMALGFIIVSAILFQMSFRRR